jgi:ribosomal protein S1
MVKAIVLDVDQDKERISLGIKQLGRLDLRSSAPPVNCARAQR